MELSDTVQTTLNTTGPSSVIIVIFVLALALLAFVAVMATSFVKLVVVMHLLRNALGIQQIPPNLALNGLAIILTIYIMAPVLQASFLAGKESNLDLKSPTAEMIGDTFSKGSIPFIEFMKKNTSAEQVEFFVNSSKDIWPEEFVQDISSDSLIILLPAFMMTELKAAFEIGFLIYLPFLVVDLIVSNVLLAMGMMMVSPMTISLPFKLLLFVVVDGWTRLIHGLVLTYS